MMERLIGSFLTTQKHTNNFYKHTLTHHSLLTAVHQFHCAGFLSISQKKSNRKEPLCNLFTQDFGYFETLGQFGSQTLGICGRICEEKQGLPWKNKEKQMVWASRDVE